MMSNKSIFTALCFLFIFSLIGIDALPVNLAIPAIGEGVEKLKQWLPLVSYIEQECKLTINLSITKNNEVIKDGLKTKNYDLAFIDSFWYHLWEKESLCLPLVQAEVMGKKDRTIILAVHKDSIYRNVRDLQDHQIAFTLKNESAAGFYIPLAMLLSLNVRPFEYFKETVFSETFQSILKGLAYGKLDAGFIVSNIYKSKENQELFNSLRIIKKSRPLPQWILIYRSDSNKNIADKIGESLIALSSSNRGSIILSKSGFTGFVVLDNKNISNMKNYINILVANNVSPE